MRQRGICSSLSSDGAVLLSACSEIDAARAGDEAQGAHDREPACR